MINRTLAGITVAQLPPIPTGLTISPTGPDPALSLPTDLQAAPGETVVVPGEFVRGVEERQVAHSKAVLLAGASLVGFVLAYEAFGPGSSGAPGDNSGPRPTPH